MGELHFRLRNVAMIFACLAVFTAINAQTVYITLDDRFDNLALCFWKNGQRQNLPGNAGGATSVLAVK
jgi:hypothetical protein